MAARVALSPLEPRPPQLASALVQNAHVRSGATKVTAVKENSENVSAAKRNAARNQLKVNWIQEDVFQFLRRAENAGAQYDLIVLDPPSFKRRSGLRDALRGYRELHMRAFKLLSKDGLVATFSCSHHVDHSAFLQTIRDAFVDTRRSARRLRRLEQAPDASGAADNS